jgi:hypothetical protein
MHFAIQHADRRADRRLQRLAYHGSAGMDIFYELPGTPLLSLRALEICLPQKDAGSRRITYDTKAFGETFFGFLRHLESNLEELRLLVENFNFERSLRDSSEDFIVHFLKKSPKKLRTLVLAGVFLNQGIPLNTDPTFQELL